MRVQPSSLNLRWALIALAGLAVACSREAPPPVTDAIGNYQPATLAEAVLLRNGTAVENFLALGVDPNEPEADGTTPLMRAVHGQVPAIAQLLIDAGADVKKANYYGVTALYIAARAGDAVATRMLLAAGADANATLPAGETVLMTAAKAGNADVVRALLTGRFRRRVVIGARRGASRRASRRSRGLLACRRIPRSRRTMPTSMLANAGTGARR